MASTKAVSLSIRSFWACTKPALSEGPASDLAERLRRGAELTEELLRAEDEDRLRLRRSLASEERCLRFLSSRLLLPFFLSLSAFSTSSRRSLRASSERTAPSRREFVEASGWSSTHLAALF